MIIRDARTHDLADATAIAAIHNELLDTSTFTWTEQHQTPEQRQQWTNARSARGFPTLVAELDGSVQGYASYADFRDSIKWPGYRFTVEHTVQVFQSAWRRGVGRALMVELLGRARSAHLHVMIGGIDASNERSLEFHERLGFREVARMPETGWKHGHYCDLVFMQRTV